MAMFDLIIRDAQIHDGLGGPPVRGTLAVVGDRIAAIAPEIAGDADMVVDAGGMALCPGFIDVHTHDDKAVLGGVEGMMPKLSQGVTSIVTGNCGVSLAPARFTEAPPSPLDLLAQRDDWRFASFGDYADQLRKVPPAVNVMALVGHMPLRHEAMAGEVDREATEDEILRMQQRLAAALAEGASGFSTGLWYPPNRAATAREVAAVGTILARFGGLYCSHMRDEAGGLLDSIHETAAAGRAMPAPVVISHHKCMFPENWGMSATSLPLIDELRDRQTLDFDAYPYRAGSSSIFPDVVRPDVPVTITWSAPYPEQAGRMLSEIAAEWQLSLREAAERLSPGGATYHQVDENDVRRILSHPACMIGSDGLPGDAFPHPRLWGTFPRILGHYSRDIGLFPLEEAIRKMTSRPAAVFGFTDRGTLCSGAFADLVLFDPETVIDTATYENPKQPAAGILRSWVNGAPAYVHGAAAATMTANGRLITRPRTGQANG